MNITPGILRSRVEELERYGELPRSPAMYHAIVAEMRSAADRIEELERARKD